LHSFFWTDQKRLLKTKITTQSLQLTLFTRKHLCFGIAPKITNHQKHQIFKILKIPTESNKPPLVFCIFAGLYFHFKWLYFIICSCISLYFTLIYCKFHEVHCIDNSKLSETLLIFFFCLTFSSFRLLFLSLPKTFIMQENE
jgi:hypothetical protein